MAQCRKCGNPKCTRRRAGEYFCQRCGMQPGTKNLDRSGTVEIPRNIRKASDQDTA